MQNCFIFVKLMLYVSIINFTYYNIYGGMMRGKYYIDIALRNTFSMST